MASRLTPHAVFLKFNVTLNLNTHHVGKASCAICPLICIALVSPIDRQTGKRSANNRAGQRTSLPLYEHPTALGSSTQATIHSRFLLAWRFTHSAFVVRHSAFAQDRAMDRARRDGGPGGGQGRRHALPEGEQQQQRQQARQSNNATYFYSTAPAAATVLPGITAFLHQQQQAPRTRQCYQQLSNLIAYPVYNHAYPERIQMVSHHQATRGSPTLSEFPNITLNTAPSSSRRSITNSDVARMQTSYKPKATTTSRVTTSTSSKTSTSNSNSSLVLRRPVRTSRYLREADRRNILSRIAKGEKQADLAKEYQVSRAAISNLKQRRNNRTNNGRKEDTDEGEEGHHEGDSGGDQEDEKGRDGEDSDSRYRHQFQQEPVRRQSLKHPRVSPELMGFDATHESDQRKHHVAHQQVSSLRASEYELKRHVPKPADYSNDSASDHDVGSSSSPYLPSPARPRSQLSPSPLRDEAMKTRLLERVTEVTTSSMETLFTRLIDQHTDARTLQLALARTARLLLEHALSAFAARDVRIPVHNQQSSAASAPLYYTGTEAMRPLCAVTVPACGGGAALLREFQVIEPHSDVGFVSPRPNGGSCDVQVPRNIHESNVLVLVELLDAQSSFHLVQALQAIILQRGVQQQYIVLTTVCSNERALVRVLQVFPGLRVVASKIFTQDDDLMSIELCALLHSRLLCQIQSAAKFELR